MNTYRRSKTARNILICILVLLLIITALLFIFCKSTVYLRIRLTKGDNVALGEIVRQTTVEQEIPYSAEDCGVSILFATYARQNIGNIHIRIEGKESGFVYVDQKESVNHIQDNAYRDFFYASDRPETDKTLRIIISSTSREKHAITIWSTPSDSLSGYALTVNGEERDSDLLMHRIISSTRRYAVLPVLMLVFVFAIAALILYPTKQDESTNPAGIRSLVIRVKNRLFGRVEPGPLKYTGREAKVFATSILIVGLLIIMIMPPFIAPDEYVHFEHIWPISQGQIFAYPYRGQNVRYIPGYYLDYISNYPVSLNGDNNPTRYSYWQMREESEVLCSTDDLVPVAGTLTSLGYVFSALAMRIGTWVGGKLQIFSITSAYNQMQLGRIGNLLFYALMVYFAIQRASHFKLTIGLIACMPMSLFLGCSLNYDAILIPTTLYFVALILSLSSDDSKIITSRDIVCVYCSVILMVGIKIAYAPFLAMLLAVPKKKYGSTRRMILCMIGAVVAGLIGLFPMLYQNSLVPPLDPKVQAELMDTKQHDWLMAHLTFIPRLISNTFILSFGQIRNSFWGALGWLETRFGFYWEAIGCFFLLITGIYEAFTFDGWIKKRWKNILPLIGWGVSLLGIFLAMYIHFTPEYANEIGGPIVYGIQGRYLIPFFLPLLLCISNRSIKRFNSDRATLMLSHITCGWGLICALITLITLLLRYWV